MKDVGRIIIIGAGPTGLGAAYRLKELGHDNYIVFEANDYVGGLAASFKDPKGFYWDIGGHVLFSHYKYFDNLMSKALPPSDWLTHDRESWIWVKNRFVPYPFQNNTRYLPKKELWECVSGIIDATLHNNSLDGSNFKDWVIKTFGRGVANLFMLPYNRKVWAFPPEKLAYNWISERVSTPKLDRVLYNIINEQDDISWGPNRRFNFPLHGGTGSIWVNLAGMIPEGKVALRHRAVKIEKDNRNVVFENGRKEKYDLLISTIPLDVMGKVCAGMGARMGMGLSRLKYSSVHVVGLGMSGRIPEKLRTKCWMYFPEDNCPFYRVTVFSNYSYNNVPDSRKYWSLMAEVSESSESPIKRKDVVADVIRGLENARLIRKGARIESVFTHRAQHAYPTPFIGRDEIVEPALDYLEAHGIYSRGRFGAWKYEIANMDHSAMQGVELVNRLLKGEKETTLVRP